MDIQGAIDLLYKEAERLIKIDKDAAKALVSAAIELAVYNPEVK